MSNRDVRRLASAPLWSYFPGSSIGGQPSSLSSRRRLSNGIELLFERSGNGSLGDPADHSCEGICRRSSGRWPARTRPGAKRHPGLTADGRQISQATRAVQCGRCPAHRAKASSLPSTAFQRRNPKAVQSKLFPMILQVAHQPSTVFGVGRKPYVRVGHYSPGDRYEPRVASIESYEELFRAADQLQNLSKPKEVR